MFSVFRTERGFTLTELMLTVAVAGTLMAMAVPVAQDVTASIKMGESTRLVERELQDARLRAVASNRSLRVRLNCPSAGFIRTVEVLGGAADAPPARCSTAAFPFPPDQDLMTRPNFDGPLHPVPNQAALIGSDIQFNPDGTAQVVANGVAATMVAPQTIRVTRRNMSRTVTVNAAGKILLVR
jgi:prepilin-type N-terminal cleavage/methylation domain-containing protein